MTIHRTPRRGTPRKRVPPSQIDYVVIDKPSGYCPKCRKYVEEKGVECKGCNAFWHYVCADVTQETLDDKWDGIDWVCDKHEPNQAVSIPSKQGSVENPDLPKEMKMINLKVNAYTLNRKQTLKKLRASINSPSKIDVKDNSQQYSIKLCLPTFEILVANMIGIGEQWGLSIKAGALDQKGNNVGAQFNLNLCTPSGKIAKTSVNCYPTTSRVVIQLNKSGKESGDWNEKVGSLSKFIYEILDKVIKQIEESSHFEALKENMLKQLNSTKEDEEGIPGLLKLKNLPGETGADQSPSSESLGSDQPHSLMAPENQSKVNDEKEDVPYNGPTSSESTFSEVQKSDGTNPVDATGSDSLEAQSLNQLRLEIKDRNEEVLKLKAELKLQMKMQNDLREKSRESDEKDTKITKIMKMKEQLGITIQTLKDKLSESELVVKSQSAQISTQEETIQVQAKAIEELNLRNECNQEVATLFMDEVLEEENEESDPNQDDTGYKDKVAKLFKDLSAEREKIDLYQLKLKEADSEIAGIKLVHEDEEKNHKNDKEKKDKEIKSLKSALAKMEKNRTDNLEQNKNLNEQLVVVEKSLSVEKSNNANLHDEVNKLVNEVETLKNQNQEKTPPAKVDSYTQTDGSQPCDGLLATLKAEKLKVEKQLKTASVSSQKLSASLEEEKKKYTDLFLQMESVKAELIALKEEANHASTSTPQREREHDEYSNDNEANPESADNLTNNSSTANIGFRLGKICYREALLPGSCLRGPNCRFGHNIRPEIRNNAEIMSEIAKVKEEKLAKCVNEFFRAGSCHKGQACRFSHKINDNHRQDPVLQGKMEEKLRMLTGGRNTTNHNQHHVERSNRLTANQNSAHLSPVQPVYPPQPSAADCGYEFPPPMTAPPALMQNLVNPPQSMQSSGTPQLSSTP